MGLFQKKKVILALGGGGARGMCTIGVLKVLEDHFGRENLPFDMVVGTSIGALIGAAYCLGDSIEKLEEVAIKFNWADMVDIGLHHTGIVKGAKFERIIASLIGDKGFDDMKIPFALTTTDIKTGAGLTHASGDLVKLVRASCAWPGIFSAVKMGDRYLMDGGVRNSIPTKAAKKFGGTFIIAVNPGFGVKHRNVNNVIKVLIQTVQIMGDELNNYQAACADVAISPELKDLDQFDFDQAITIIRQGELAAERKLKELKRKLLFHR